MRWQWNGVELKLQWQDDDELEWQLSRGVDRRGEIRIGVGSSNGGRAVVGKKETLATEALATVAGWT